MTILLEAHYLPLVAALCATATVVLSVLAFVRTSPNTVVNALRFVFAAISLVMEYSNYRSAETDKFVGLVVILLAITTAWAFYMWYSALSQKGKQGLLLAVVLIVAIIMIASIFIKITISV